MKLENNMSVREYREKHPNCQYCENCEYWDLGTIICGAKQKWFMFNRARWCPLYQAKSYKRGGLE